MKLTEKQISAIRLDIPEVIVTDFSRDYLNERYGMIDVFGRDFHPADILEQLDWMAWIECVELVVTDLIESNKIVLIDGSYYFKSQVENYLKNEYTEEEFI